MASPPTLTLSTIQAVPKTKKFQTKETKLGDGYEQVANAGKLGNLIDYNITTPYLSLTDSLSLVNQLAVWKGVQSFYWSPIPDLEPLRLFICKQWQLTLATLDSRQLNATFEGVIK